MPSPGSRASPENSRRRLASTELRFLSDEVGSTLGDITEYLDSIRNQGFGVASRNLLGRDELPVDPLLLIESLAQQLAGRLSGPPQLLLRKVLQETFLSIAGLDYDLDELDPDRGASRYFEDNDVSDLLFTVLDLYVSDSVWIGMDGDLWPGAPDTESIEDWRARIDEMSRKAVRSVLSELGNEGDLSRLVAKPAMGRSIMTRFREVLLETDLPDRGNPSVR